MIQVKAIFENGMLRPLQPVPLSENQEVTVTIDGDPDSLEARFRRLAATWENAVAYHSASSIRNNHPAYREIIRLGPNVVPLLLRDLEQNQTHWFAALREITGADPVPQTAAGNIPQMVEAWLNWAKENGYRW